MASENRNRNPGTGNTISQSAVLSDHKFFEPNQKKKTEEEKQETHIRKEKQKY